MEGREIGGERMRVLRTIVQVAILWLYYYVGVLIVEWTGVFIPASIIGLILLWISLTLNLINVKFIQDGAGFLIGFLTLFFIPTTVGVIEYPELLTSAGMLLILAVILSTSVTLVVTGKVSQWIEKKEQLIDEEVSVDGSHSRDY